MYTMYICTCMYIMNIVFFSVVKMVEEMKLLKSTSSEYRKRQTHLFCGPQDSRLEPSLKKVSHNLRQPN